MIQQNNQTLQLHGAGPLTVGCYCFGVGEVINYVKKITTNMLHSGSLGTSKLYNV